MKGVNGVSDNEIKEELEKQLQMLSKLSERKDLTVLEHVRIAQMINTISISLANF